MIVVDTNVAAYLLAGRGRAAEAAEALLRRDPEWAAPVLLASELRNVMVGLVRRGDLRERTARAMLADAVELFGDRLVAVTGDTVLRTALETGLTAYDAEFVTLARALGTPLVTADRAILRAAPDLAVPLDGAA